MPQAVGAGADADGSLSAVPQRPQAITGASTSALDSVASAGQSLTAETNETAQQAHSLIVAQQRKEAAAEAARAEREAKRWVAPVSNYRVSAGFGSAGRMWSRQHTGIDLAARSGSEVRALSSGEITFAGYDGPYGNKIEITHHDGTVTWYAHLSGFERRSGSVSPGDLIGRVGSTGNSTGPHLHLEVHPNGGDAVNPRAWLAEHGLNL